MAGRASSIYRYIRTWGFPVMLAATSTFVGIKGHLIDPVRQGSAKHLIVPPQGNKMYHGAIANHCADPLHLLCFEQKFGQKVDIALRFMNFIDLRSARPFPTEEAAYLRKRGGALLIMLEPCRGPGSPNLLKEILKGKFNKQLEAFARGAAQYDGPVFLNFDHKGGDPALYQNAYRYVHDLISEIAPNITWVWSLYPGDKIELSYPGDKYVNWIAINFFQRPGESAHEIIEGVDKSLAMLKKYDKPIMIGKFGSSAPEKEKAAFLSKIIQKFKEWKIKAFVYFNISKTEEDGAQTWPIAEGEPVQNYRAGLKILNLHGNILTKEGELENELSETAPPNCEEIEKELWDAWDARWTRNLNEFIENREFNLEQDWVPHDNNKLRLQLSKAYRELFRLTEDKSLHRKALRHLKTALKSPDKSIQYHPKIKYVREYAEILLELADFHLENRDLKKAQGWLDRLSRDLSNWRIKLAHDIREESVLGYRNRANLIKASIMEKDRLFFKAKELYASVAQWAEEEAERSWLTHLWKGEYRPKLRFIAAKARIGQIRIQLRQEGKLDEEHLGMLIRIFEWEESGSEEGFMDLSYEAFIYLMRGYLLADSNAARRRFNFELPWEKINEYQDLKKSLEIEADLTFVPDKWHEIVRGLTRRSKFLPDRAKAELATINDSEGEE